MLFSDGLPTKLRHPVPPIDKPPLPPAHPQVITPPQKKGGGFSSIFPILGKSSKEESSSEKTSPSQSKVRSPSLPSDALSCPSSANDSNVLNDSSSAAAASPPDTTKTKDSTRKSSMGSLNFPLNILTMGRPRKKPKTKDSEEGKSAPISNLANMNGPISKSMNTIKFAINENEETYNVPSNILATHNALASNKFDHSQRDDRFTQSDKPKHGPTVASEPELFKEEGIYFVEPPTKVVPLAALSANDLPLDLPYFPHSNNSMSNSSLFDLGLNSNGKMNATLASILQTGHAESHLSVESTFSNELELMLAENITNFQGPNYYIPGSSIKQIAKIGKGEFGAVWKSRMEFEGQNGEIKEIDVAVKTLIDERKENRTDFLREANMMIKLKHHCIVQMIGISKVFKIWSNTV